MPRRALTQSEIAEAMAILARANYGVPSQEDVDRLSELTEKFKRNSQPKVRGQHLADLITRRHDG